MLWSMDQPPELDASRIGAAMWTQWRDAELRPERGLEHVEAHNGDIYVEHWSSLGTLHKIRVPGQVVRGIDARTLPPVSTGDPNETVASWLSTMIEEELDSAPRSPQSFTFDPFDPT